MTPELRKAILAHARRHAAMNPPEEMAGVVRGGRFVAMPNLAADRARHFAIDPSVIDGIDAIVHSHPGGPACPSAEDMAQQQATGVPWLIAVVPTIEISDCREEVFCFDGVPRLDMQAGYRHGVNDCYSLIRGFYAGRCGVTLPDYPRDWGWWHDGFCLYEKFFAGAGFYELKLGDGGGDVPRPHDVFLAAIRSDTPNHGGVLLEGGLILHHLAGSRPHDESRLPRKEPLGRWQKFITHWLRLRPQPRQEKHHP